MKLSSFDAILNLGDLDYKCSPDKYFTDVLNSKRKYQFMSVIGNHDAKSQCSDDIARKFLNNVYSEMTNKKNSDISCEFSESKFMWSCKYKNMVNIIDTSYNLLIIILFYILIKKNLKFCL